MKRDRVGGLKSWQLILVLILFAAGAGWILGIVDRPASRPTEWIKAECVVDGSRVVSQGLPVADGTKVQAYTGEYTIHYVFQGKGYSQRLEVGPTDRDRRWVEQQIAVVPGSPCPFSIRVNPKNAYEVVKGE